MAKSKHRRRQVPGSKPTAGWRERVAKLITSFKRARTTLTKNEAEFRRYIDQDTPSYQAWLDAEFGKERAQINQLHEDIEATRERILAFHTAGPSDESPFSELVDAEDFKDFMNAAMFRSFMDDVRGIDIDDLSPEAYNDAFDEFQGAMDCIHEGNPAEFRQKIMQLSRNESRENRQAVKAIYRSLCKSLHPDHNPDVTEAGKALWADLQEAYEALDLKAMQEVESRWKLETGQPLDPRDEPRLAALVESYRARNQFLREDLRMAKEDPAWGFSTRESLEDLAAETAADVKFLIRQLKMDLKVLRREESRISGKPVKAASPKPVRTEPVKAVREQFEFAF